MSIQPATSNGINLSDLYAAPDQFISNSAETGDVEFNQPSDWNKGKAQLCISPHLGCSTVSFTAKRDFISKMNACCEQVMCLDSRFYERIFKYERSNDIDTSKFQKNLLNLKIIAKTIEIMSQMRSASKKILDEKNRSKKIFITGTSHYTTDVKGLDGQILIMRAFLKDTLKNFSEHYKTAYTADLQNHLVYDSQCPNTPSSKNVIQPTSEAKKPSLISQSPSLAYQRIQEKWEQTLKQRQKAQLLGPSSM